MSRRFQFSLKWWLLVAIVAAACVVGGIALMRLVADTGQLARLVAAKQNPRAQQDLLARLHGNGTVLAVLMFLAAGLAALFVVVKLCRLHGRPSKK